MRSKRRYVWAAIARRGPRHAIERMIKKAIAAHPDVNGSPISLVRITRAGIEWPARGECPER